MTEQKDFIQEIAARLRKTYDNSEALRAEFPSFDSYVESCLDRAALAVEFERNKDLMAEFGNVERYISYVLAAKSGLVRVIGNKAVTL